VVAGVKLKKNSIGANFKIRERGTYELAFID